MARTTRTPKAPARDFYAEFIAQSSITKKEALKLRPGSIVEVRWMDKANTRCIVSEKTRHINPGELYLNILTDDQGVYMIGHTQIVKVHPVNVFTLLTDL